MFKVFVALAAACFVTPAVAAGSTCHDATDLLAATKKSQALSVWADFKTKGVSLYDREIILGTTDGSELLFFFAKGCLITKPLALGPTVSAPAPDPVPTPDSAPVPKPKLQGGGQEIGT